MSARRWWLPGVVLFALVTGGAPGIVAAGTEPIGPTPDGYAAATFAGGCFWCMQPPYDDVDGVKKTVVGYTAGHVAGPAYEDVVSGETGHTEAVRVVFDPDVVRYEELLAIFWRNIDPTAEDRQFCDQGSQYRSGIYYHDEAQRKAAERSRDDLVAADRLPGRIVTEIEAVDTFYVAESYHQDYYRKNPLRYRFYRANCGRDSRLRELWGDEAGG